MKTIIILFFFLFFCSSYAATYTTVANGSFDNPKTWDKGLVPNLSSEDTAIISHSIYLSRSEDTIFCGIKSTQNNSRFYIYIKNSGTLCFPKFYHLFQLNILVEGRWFTKKLNQYYCNTLVQNGGLSYSTNSVRSEYSKWTVLLGGKTVVDTTEIFDCSEIKDDTSKISSKCPRASFYLKATEHGDSFVRLTCITNIPLFLTITYDFTEYKFPSNGFIDINKKDYKLIKLIIYAVDQCDRVYSQKQKIKLTSKPNTTSSSVNNTKYTKKFVISYTPNEYLKIQSIDNKLYRALLYV